MSACRGCAGTGIGAHITPREAQLLREKVWLTKPPPGYENVPVIADVRLTKRYCRVDAWHGLDGEPVTRGRLAMSGPLLYVIQECKRWLKDGWSIAAGSQVPDEGALCEWCGGSGRTAHILTVHNMEESLCQKER